MATQEQARAFTAEFGAEITYVGEHLNGWSVVSREYQGHKHAVRFRIVIADPDGDLWAYDIAEHHEYGTDVDSEPIPVTMVTASKTVVSFVPRLIPRTSKEHKT